MEKKLLSPISPGPTMDHALNMISEPEQPQYAGHGNMEPGMPEENLMSRAVNYMNKYR